MGLIIQLSRFPDHIQKKIAGLGPSDHRGGKLCTLIFNSGPRIKNVYILEDEPDTKDEFKEIKERIKDLKDVMKQAWDEREPRTPWDDVEWWKS